jgi:Mg-chelatase subunit ChlD
MDINNNNINVGTSLALSSTVEFEQVPFSHAGEFTAMATISAPFYQPEKRAAVDVVAVIDKSGSMEGEKLTLVKSMLSHMVDSLSNVDQLCLVAYSDSVTTQLPHTVQDDEGKTHARNAVSSLSASGCTNLCGGLVQGVKELRTRSDKNEVASCLLFTDGLANVGPSTASLIMNAVRKWSPKDVSSNSNNAQKMGGDQYPLPCTINTFGFGSDHDATMLKTIAESASGVYYYIEDAEHINKAFADCFAGLLSTVGQDIVLSFEAGTGISIKKILTKFKVTEEIPNAHYVVRLGDIQSEEKRDIIIVVDLPALDCAEPSFPILKISLSYKNVVTSSMEKKSIVVAVLRPEITPEQKRDHNLDKQHNRIIAAEALEQASEAGEKGDLQKGKDILTTAISRIKESVSASDEFCVTLVSDLEKCKAGLANKETFKHTGHQTMTHNYMAHSYQRSTNVAWDSQSAYQTSTRHTMRSAWDK